MFMRLGRSDAHVGFANRTLPTPAVRLFASYTTRELPCCGAAEWRKSACSCEACVRPRRLPQGCTIVKPEHICVMSGCGAVLSAMFNLLGEVGDAVLIPAPYYPGFDFDTQVC